MSTTYRQALRESARVAVTGCGHSAMWDDIAAGAIAVFALTMRMALLLTFPVSVPFLAWVIVKADRLAEQRHIETRARMRAQFHGSTAKTAPSTEKEKS